jgi:hypothetical protein
VFDGIEDSFGGVVLKKGPTSSQDKQNAHRIATFTQWTIEISLTPAGLPPMEISK